MNIFFVFVLSKGFKSCNFQIREFVIIITQPGHTFNNNCIVLSTKLRTTLKYLLLKDNNLVA